MSQNIFKSPKAKVQAVAPKAKCVKDWTRGGNYRIDFGQDVKDFNGDTITSMHTGTANPADAWAAAYFPLPSAIQAGQSNKSAYGLLPDDEWQNAVQAAAGGMTQKPVEF